MKEVYWVAKVVTLVVYFCIVTVFCHERGANDSFATVLTKRLIVNDNGLLEGQEVSIEATFASFTEKLLTGEVCVLQGLFLYVKLCCGTMAWYEYIPLLK